MAALEDLRREPLKESEIKLAVEAVLFSSSKALMVREIAQAVGAEPRKVKRALTGLKREYQKRQTSVEVAKIGTKWTLQLKNRFVPVAAGYASTKIPKNLLKTVALIATFWPVTTFCNSRLEDGARKSACPTSGKLGETATKAKDSSTPDGNEMLPPGSNEVA